MARRGVTCTAAELLVTTGSQQGLDLLPRVMVAPGDVVLTEQPAYPATLSAMRLHQARIVTIPVDGAGLDFDRLGTLLASGSRSCCTRCGPSRTRRARRSRANAG